MNAEFRQNESCTLPEERRFAKWLGRVESIFGVLASDELASMLYEDGYTPHEAAEELRFQVSE